MKKFFAYSILSLSFFSIINLPEANAHDEAKYDKFITACKHVYFENNKRVVGMASGTVKRTRNQMAVVNGMSRPCRKARNHIKQMAVTGIHGRWYTRIKNSGNLGDI